jgi:transketolase N-terminal domain/subunit
MDHEPRPDGKIVEAANFGSRMEADAAIALLQANGIQASGKYGDAGGWLPYTSLVDGFRVVVFDVDVDAAQALLAAEHVYEEGLDSGSEAP